MNTMFVAAAVLVITIGHIFRIRRWKSLIAVYEDVPADTVVTSMGLGYVTDLIVPLHLGDLVRAVYIGKHLENRTSFSLATIFIDRLLDVVIVTVLYGWFYLRHGSDCLSAFLSYCAVTVCLVAVLLSALSFSRLPKHVILLVSSIFNEQIQLWILSFGWSCRCTFRNILTDLSKPLLLIRTICMWSCYLLSYFLFSNAIENEQILPLFNTMFEPGAVSPLLSVASGSPMAVPVFCYHTITCALLLLLGGLLHIFPSRRQPRKPELIIPYNNESSRLDFYRVYFSDVRDKQEITSFLAINKDVTIVRNYSAGSNATTLLCIRGEQMFFRKYAFGADGEKLYAQVQWLLHNAEKLSVASILHVEKTEKICCYDMPFLNSSVSFFDFIHSVPAKQAWTVLSHVIDDLEQGYSAQRTADADAQTIRQYVEAKVLGNLQKITVSQVLSQLTGYDTVEINGISYPNLPYYMEKLTALPFWEQIFAQDYYSDIHGDLTIENIIYNSSFPHGYYLIDPNGGNLHDSPDLDYAKLLQSLHGGYEFLMHTPKVDVHENRISFHMARSAAYETLYRELRDYLFRKFSPGRVRSIYFHEIIHWLRLMPYKINRDSNRAPMFYAGMMLILHDIWEEFKP